MPKIAEIKEINGEIWVKIISSTMLWNGEEITLYTRQEIDAVRRQAVEAFRERINGLSSL